MHTYSELRPAPIGSTISTLARRIRERFPDSGLSRVAAELVQVAQQNQLVIDQLRRPLWWVRGLTALTIAAVVALTIWAGIELRGVVKGGAFTVAELLQSIDAATSELIFLSLVVLFLISLETRLKRRTALRMLHRLRSVAHVVDMHQLTKDPEHVMRRVAATASSPVRTLSRVELPRYLDYCSELLALTSKLAALHAQHLYDPVILNAVNDIEALTADLSRKIWQKISILAMVEQPPSDSPAATIVRSEGAAEARAAGPDKGTAG
ncbi:MAG: hypothetical protein H7X75_05445 [Burkholderiaceae bacterium]|nr:hypothetical protein [Burkholderiaceae bacterium]